MITFTRRACRHLACLLLLASAISLAGGAVADPAEDRPIVQVEIDGASHAMVAELIRDAIGSAVEIDAEALLVQLSTPGGSLTATREINQMILASPVPVIVYVGPAGAQAASAGFFILMAADVAAMAPGTNTGAAHPVGGGGEDIEGHMGDKVRQDTLAMIRSLAEERGRDLELATAAVEDSRAYSASEAFEGGLIDHISPSTEALLASLDGSEVRRPDGSMATLSTADATLVAQRWTGIERLLAALAHPQIAGLLMALGMLGLYFEFSNPGTLVPGVTGAICLVLGFFALSVLPINYAGVALMLLAGALFVAELYVPTFGVLTTGGAVALALGLMMTYRDLEPSMRPHPAWPVVMGLVMLTVVTATSRKTWRLRQQPAITGAEGMIAARGVARGPLAAGDPAARGKVMVRGELWSATSLAPIEDGQAIEVLAVDGLELRVRAADDANPPTRSRA